MDVSFLTCLCFTVGLFGFVTAGNTTVHLHPVDIELQSGLSTVANMCLSQPLSSPVTIYFTYDTGHGIYLVDDREVISPLQNLTLGRGEGGCTPLNVTGVNPGHVNLGLNASSQVFTDLESAFTRIKVVHSSVLIVISSVIGWIYFAAWTLGGYPQLYLNWRRKSVTGISLDFISYNITSFIAYSLFNSGLYWFTSVQEDYFEIHPRGINPVQLNDVIFALHALFLNLIIVLQCFIYDRGGQKLSKTCYVLQGLILLFCAVSLCVAVAGKITWLTYLYYYSYIKLGITVIKYAPQVYIIYQNKSIQGFSIPSVWCDFTGGLFSMLQMFVLSYNSDDWGSILGDPTKFGLGLVSMLYDIIFFVQGYCIYKKSSQSDEKTLLIKNNGIQ